MHKRLTKEERVRFDVDVLSTVAEIGGGLTWRISDYMNRPGKPWHGIGLQTSDVLRACRRLERLNLIRLESRRTSYRAMLFWEITDAGRSMLTMRPSNGGDTDGR